MHDLYLRTFLMRALQIIWKRTRTAASVSGRPRPEALRHGYPLDMFRQLLDAVRVQQPPRELHHHRAGGSNSGLRLHFSANEANARR